MIYDTLTLHEKYKKYSNINQKIALEAKKGSLTRIKNGLYSDNVQLDAPLLANICQSPSYLSFEWALYIYGLIPEFVSVYTSAVFGKKNNRSYSCKEAVFEYLSIPDKAFPYGVIYRKNEDGIRYKIATKEKALLDIIYTKYPVRSIKDIKTMLFEDLRIDEEEFFKMDYDFIRSVGPLYHSNSINSLIKYIDEERKI